MYANTIHTEEKVISQVRVSEIFMFPDGRLDTKNAAAYIGLSVKTLAMMRCEGRGPKFVKKGRIFYFQEDLDEWLKAGRVLSTAQVGRR
jgi:hypothetical protein